MSRSPFPVLQSPQFHWNCTRYASSGSHPSSDSASGYEERRHPPRPSRDFFRRLRNSIGIQSCPAIPANSSFISVGKLRLEPSASTEPSQFQWNFRIPRRLHRIPSSNTPPVEPVFLRRLQFHWNGNSRVFLQTAATAVSHSKFAPPDPDTSPVSTIPMELQKLLPRKGSRELRVLSDTHTTGG